MLAISWSEAHLECEVPRHSGHVHPPLHLAALVEHGVMLRHHEVAIPGENRRTIRGNGHEMG